MLGLTPYHSGSYTCLVTSTVGSDEVTYEVQVITPPTLMDTRQISSDVVVKMNRPVTLSCSVTASPPPEVVWYKVNEKTNFSA